MSDELAGRMKRYEARETERKLLPRSYFVARIDGRCFSRFTADMARPYDVAMFEAMDATARYLVEETHALVGYTQSDEINLVFGPHDEPMFGGRVFKLTSVLAGMASARFTVQAMRHWPERAIRMPPAFDCRVFEVPSREEAVNVLIWRELDATKNAVSMAARSKFSPSKMFGQSSAQLQEMLFQEHGINFATYPWRFKRGAYFRRVVFEKELDAETLAKIPEMHRPTAPVTRSEVREMYLPPILKVENRVETLLDGAKPIHVAPKLRADGSPECGR